MKATFQAPVLAAPAMLAIYQKREVLGPCTFPVEFADDGPTDPGYAWRCIVMDAQRAFKLGDRPEQACSWAEGTPEHQWWHSAYGPSLRTVKP